jgi:thiol-disulfide isomerase/thioredoxin
MTRSHRPNYARSVAPLLAHRARGALAARIGSLLGAIAALGSLATLDALALPAGCAPASTPAPRSQDTSVAAPPPREEKSQGDQKSERAPKPRPPLAAIHDDVPAAVAKAKAEGKAVLVDAWAPWCHTCLSMQNYVLSDPSLAPLADRVVLVAVDTDRPENAAFLERHAVNVWPTFFVIDPAKDEVAGYWPGAASVKEFRAFVEEGAGLVEEGRGLAEKEGSPARALAEAKAAHAAGDYARAAKGYERAAQSGGPSFARRSEALYGWLHALYRSRDFAACARVGRAHAAEVEGAAMPADFSSFLLACAGKLPKGAEQDAARKAAIDRLRKLVASPPPESSADDRADALSILAEGLKETGDAAGAQKANEARLAMLEEAARAARSPEEAATYDYARAGAYVALGKAEEAVAMLKERERQMPGSYEPPARLAEVLSKIDRAPEALEAISRAIAKAYGPRKLRYLKLRAELQGRLGDTTGEVATLREEVAGHEALAKGQADKDRLADARRRLEEALKRAAKLPVK